jgi:hypothetical protein
LVQGAKVRYQTRVVKVVTAAKVIQKKKTPVGMKMMRKKEMKSRMPTVTRKKMMARKEDLGALARKPLDPKLRRTKSLQVVLRHAGQADGASMGGSLLHFWALIPMEFGGVYFISSGMYYYVGTVYLTAFMA